MIYGPAPGQFLLAPSQYAPAGRTVLTTTSATMAAVSSGNASTGTFTAPASGSVLVTVSCAFLSNTSGNNVAFALAATGTVTPLLSNVVNVEANFFIQGTFQFLVTGLTPGTSYNFDLLFSSPSATTVTVAAQGVTSVTPGSNSASPVTMTVQAV